MTAADEPAEATASADGKDSKPAEWWDDPRMPWKGKPTKAELWCIGLIIATGAYGLLTIPVRPWILGSFSAPTRDYVLAVFNGSNIAMVDLGALMRVGQHQPLWWLALIAASLTSIKFDWLWWWAGRLWGRGVIDMVAARSKWAARTAYAAERLAKRFGGPAVFLVWFIPFLPSSIIYAFVGDARMSLKKFLAIDFAAGIVYRGIWMYLGYRMGATAKDLVNELAKYALWLTIAGVIVVFVSVYRQQRRFAAGR
ncbi:DedA family protein [Rudaeicoccus suwonensis]|uniref:Membrane protein DedA with SNARE-associated domain n=1 Tax=Rudaeicoccus suwonensis TaxID=657409 RepID=A0A561E9K7_9MICO|nr:VTT domain-containing protein [Rudaeicoccus suwonensis]TWE12308.1 membrane protein DedA with SNARE-associated domain [Rudaeicoccus suwonensis]